MPPVVIPNTIQVSSIWHQSGVPFAVNVHHYIDFTAAPITQARVELTDATYKAQFTASGLAGFCAATMNLDHVSVRDLREPNLPLFDGTGAAVPGTAASDPLPLNVALVATLRTAFAGRRFRGRHYQPCLAESANLVTGTASQQVQDALALFLNELQDDMELDGLELSVSSVAARDAMGVLIPPSSQPVTQVVVRNGVWDTQRRRTIPGI